MSEISKVRLTLFSTLLATFFLFILIFFRFQILNALEFFPKSPATCLPDQCFCENISTSELKQFSNSISSLAFCGVSLFLLFRFGIFSFARKGNRRFTSFVYYYSALVFLIGIGSFYYHSQLTFWGQFMDVAGMNAFAFLLILSIDFLKEKWKNYNFLIYNMILNLVSCLTIWYFPETRRYLFLILLLISVFMFTLKNQNANLHKFFIIKLAIGIQLVAFLIWLLDIKRIICDPNFFLQGHAIWHILSAINTYLVFEFFRSNYETIPTKERLK